MREREAGGGGEYFTRKEILLLEKKAIYIKCDVVQNLHSMVFSVHKIKNFDMKNQWMKICYHRLLPPPRCLHQNTWKSCQQGEEARFSRWPYGWRCI